MHITIGMFATTSAIYRCSVWAAELPVLRSSTPRLHQAFVDGGLEMALICATQYVLDRVANEVSLPLLGSGKCIQGCSKDLVGEGPTAPTEA